jgi:hypothetical protein
MKILDIEPQYITRPIARKLCKNKYLLRKYLLKYELIDNEYLLKKKKININSQTYFKNDKNNNNQIGGSYLKYATTDLEGLYKTIQPKEDTIEEIEEEIKRKLDPLYYLIYLKETHNTDSLKDYLEKKLQKVKIPTIKDEIPTFVEPFVNTFKKDSNAYITEQRGKYNQLLSNKHEQNTTTNEETFAEFIQKFNISEEFNLDATKTYIDSLFKFDNECTATINHAESTINITINSPPSRTFTKVNIHFEDDFPLYYSDNIVIILKIEDYKEYEDMSSKYEYLEKNEYPIYTTDKIETIYILNPLQGSMYNEFQTKLDIKQCFITTLQKRNLSQYDLLNKSPYTSNKISLEEKIFSLYYSDIDIYRMNTKIFDTFIELLNYIRDSCETIHDNIDKLIEKRDSIIKVNSPKILELIKKRIKNRLKRKKYLPYLHNLYNEELSNIYKQKLSPIDKKKLLETFNTNLLETYLKDLFEEPNIKKDIIPYDLLHISEESPTVIKFRDEFIKTAKEFSAEKDRAEYNIQFQSNDYNNNNDAKEIFKYFIEKCNIKVPFELKNTIEFMDTLFKFENNCTATINSDISINIVINGNSHTFTKVPLPSIDMIERIYLYNENDIYIFLQIDDLDEDDVTPIKVEWLQNFNAYPIINKQKRISIYHVLSKTISKRLNTAIKTEIQLEKTASCWNEEYCFFGDNIPISKYLGDTQSNDRFIINHRKKYVGLSMTYMKNLNRIDYSEQTPLVNDGTHSDWSELGSHDDEEEGEGTYEDSYKYKEWYGCNSNDKNLEEDNIIKKETYVKITTNSEMLFVLKPDFIYETTPEFNSGSRIYELIDNGIVKAFVSKEIYLCNINGLDCGNYYISGDYCNHLTPEMTYKMRLL